MAVFQCKNCNITKNVADKFIGRKVRCPECDQDISVVSQDSLDELEPLLTGDDIGENVEEAIFLCEQCGHSESASAEAVGEERSCRECSAKGSVVLVNSRATNHSEDDVDLADLVDDLSEGVDEEVTAATPIKNKPMQDKFTPSDDLPHDLANEKGGRVSFFHGNPARNFFSGLTTGATSFIFCIVLAVLIYPAGWESGHFSMILTVILASAVAGGAVAVVMSRIHFGVVALDPSTAAVLAIIVAAVVGAMPDAPVEIVIATTLACSMGLALMAGILAWLTWGCKSGSWIRFMPVQILGGVLAGLGVSVICNAYLFMTGKPLNLSVLFGGLTSIPIVFESGSFWAWLPGVLFGGLLFEVFRKSRNPLWLVLTVLCAGTLWYFLPSFGIAVPPEIVESYGQLAYAFDPGRYAFIYSSEFIASIDWGVIEGLKIQLAAGVVLLLTMALYKITRAESALGREISLQNELRVLGSYNVVAGLVGGAPLSFCLGRSLGNHRGGATAPLATFIAVLVLAGAMVFSAPLFQFIPVFIPGGVLIYFGLNLISKWLFEIKAEFFRNDDYLLLVLTFIVTVTLGFVLGVGTGLALAMMVSVTRYGSGGVVKQILSGATHRSHVDRAPVQLDHLKQHGDAIFVIRLQGFVTVGSFYGVIKEARRRIALPGKEAVSSMVFDFSAVSRFGSAMNQGFARLHTLGLAADISLVLTNIPFEIEDLLEVAGYVDCEHQRGFKVFQNLDYALEWSEDQLLEAAELLSAKELSLPELLEPVFLAEHIPYLMKLLQPIKVKQGDYVFRQGDFSDAMYFVQSGMYRVELFMEGSKTLRIKKMGPGAVFGEMGLYTEAPRSASVSATEGGTVYRLSKKRIAIIETKLPKLKSSIDRFLVNLLADRVANANIMVRDLLR